MSESPTRKQVHTFEEASEILAGLKKAEEDFEKLISTKCSWDDPEDVAAYRNEAYHESRMARIKMLHPSLRCPLCRKFIQFSRGWVLMKNRTAARCRRCHCEAEAREKMQWRRFGTPVNPIFTDYEVRAKINGKAMTEVREKLGITATRFAERCGWSRGFQWKLEQGEMLTVSLETMDTIYQVIRSEIDDQVAQENENADDPADCR